MVAALQPARKNVAATISIRGIAELVGARHDHVMRDIRNMLAELKITDPSFGVYAVGVYP